MTADGTLVPVPAHDRWCAASGESRAAQFSEMGGPNRSTRERGPRADRKPTRREQAMQQMESAAEQADMDDEETLPPPPPPESLHDSEEGDQGQEGGEEGGDHGDQLQYQDEGDEHEQDDQNNNHDGEEDEDEYDMMQDPINAAMLDLLQDLNISTYSCEDSAEIVAERERKYARYVGKTGESPEDARRLASFIAAGEGEEEDGPSARKQKPGTWSPSKPGQAVDCPLTKEQLLSLALASGAKGMTELQYIGMREVVIACLRDFWQVVLAKSALMSINTSQPPQQFDNLVKEYEARLPLISRRSVSRIQAKDVPPMQMRCQEFVCHPPDEGCRLNPWKSTSRVVLPSTHLERDLCFSKTCHPILDPILKAEAEEVRRNPLIPPAFFDCDMWKRRTLWMRVACYGALADAFDGEAAGDEDGAGMFLKRLFVTGSLIRLNFASGQRRFNPSTASYSVLDQRSVVEVEMVGEPVIASHSIPVSEVEDIGCIFEKVRCGDILWRVNICASQPEGFNGTREGDSEEDAHPAAFFSHHRCYLAFSCFSGMLDETKKVNLIVVSTLPPNMDEDPVSAEPVERTTVVWNPPEWERGSLRPCCGVAPKENLIPTYNAHGVLCLVVPWMLYADDFDVSKDGKRKAGGVYLSYRSMLESHRTGAQSVRVICVASGGICSDAVLEAIAEDMEEMRDKGKIMYTAYGPVHVRAVCVGFNTDFVQASKSTHHTGHGSYASCTACSTRHGASESAANYTAQATSASLSVVRSVGRSSAVREGVDDSEDLDPSDDLYLSDAVLQHLSVNQEFLDTAGRVYEVLRERAEEHDGVFRRGREPVYQAMRLVAEMSDREGTFCDNKAVFAAPDHLWFLGLSKDLLDVIFLLLETPEKRNSFEQLLLVAARNAGLQAPKKILRSAATKSGSWVSGIGVTQLAAVMLVAPACLSTLQASQILHPRKFEAISKLLTSLSHIVNLMYYFPTPCTSTRGEAEDREKAVRLITDRVAEYLEIVTQLCRDGDAISKVISKAVFSIIDCPNIHRAPEFVGVWLPGAGYNMKHLQELLFEKVHQLVKFLAKYNELYSHLGLDVMNRNMRLETVNRTLLGRDESKTGPASMFAWDSDDTTNELFRATLRMQYGNRDQERFPENRFISVHVEREWTPAGLQVRLADHTTFELNKLIRLDLDLSDDEDDFMSSSELSKFGERAASHNCIKSGDFISGLTDCDPKVLDKKIELNGVMTDGKWVEPLEHVPLENNLSAAFPEKRVVLFVEDILVVYRAPPGSRELQARMLVVGKEIVPDSETVYGTTKLWKSTGYTMWAVLDASYRRVLGMPFVEAEYEEEEEGEEGSLLKEGYVDADADAEECMAAERYVIYLRKDGYPSRAE